MEDKYIPVPCQFYDVLESLAVKKTKSFIVYKDENIEKTVEDFIIDFKTKNKEEFLILNNGTQIRLDKIIKINEMIPLNIKC
jgi:Rho-binding antiterminator